MGKPLGVEHVRDIQEVPAQHSRERPKQKLGGAVAETSAKSPSFESSDRILGAITSLLLLQKVSRGQFGVEINGLNREDFRAEQSVFVCRPCSGGI